MLLAAFLLDLSLGLLAFLPLVGRRNSGVKFYRLVFITAGSLDAAAALSLTMAAHSRLAEIAMLGVASITFLYLVFRYPKRLVYRLSIVFCALATVSAAILTFAAATKMALPAAVAGALCSAALLGSMTLAMLLGHWYLVVRGMAIDPLMRLTWAILAGIAIKTAAVCLSLWLLSHAGVGWGSPFYRLVVVEGIFFWMRAGWGIVVPLLLFPMIHGTVKIRSTMAATGILYVGVVAVIIGEVLGGFLSSLISLPV